MGNRFSWWKQISVHITGAIFLVTIFFPSIGRAAMCCNYTINPDAAPPAWMTSLPDSSVYVEQSGTGACLAPDKVPYISTYESFYEVAGYPDACSTIQEVSASKQAITANPCCRLLDDQNNTVACVDKKKGSSDANCLQLLASQYKKGYSIVAHSQACADVPACQTLANAQDAAKSKPPTIANVSGSTQAPPWTKEDCVKVQNADGVSKNVWVPPQDNPNVTTGAYCFVRPLKTNFEINIGTIASVQNIPDYINTVYKFVLGFGVLLAVLIIMISGVQWMVSGIASQISGAKERMLKAALGLVILFGANVLIYTINPQIAQLQTPPIMAIRPDTFKSKQVACDPATKNSCADSGPDFYCEPTLQGIANACDKQTKLFVGAIFAAGAASVAAPFAISSAAGAVSSFAETIATNGFRQTMVQIGKSALSNLAKTAITDEVTKKIGKTMAPVLLASGAYVLFSGSGAPPDGICVQADHSKQDGQICSADAQCQSSKCLVTKAQCKVRTFGICVSGQLLEPCSLTDAKYGCTAGTCIETKQGSKHVGISVGFCSDGTKLGMPCDNNKITCDKVEGVSAECIQGTCREKGYFTDEGVVYKSTVWNPTCVLPAECQPYDTTTFAGSSKLITAPDGSQFKVGNAGVGCLKPADAQTNLPARLLLPAQTGALDATFYREFSSIGFCVVNDKHDFQIQSSAGINTSYNSPCMVNVRPSQGNLETKFVSDLNAQFATVAKKFGLPASTLPASIAGGMRVDTVGCNGGTAAACKVSVTDFYGNHSATTLADGSFSLLGSCTDDFSWSNGEGSYTFLNCTNPGIFSDCSVAMDAHATPNADQEFLTIFDDIGSLF